MKFTAFAFLTLAATVFGAPTIVKRDERLDGVSTFTLSTINARAGGAGSPPPAPGAGVTGGLGGILSGVGGALSGVGGSFSGAGGALGGVGGLLGAGG